jgi:hypothetical protein
MNSSVKAVQNKCIDINILFVARVLISAEKLNAQRNDIISVVMHNVEGLHNVDRINKRIVVINNETKSDLIDLTRIKKMMNKFRLKFIILIANSDLLNTDIKTITSIVKPAEIIEL